jgi:hypothetical protein
MPSVTQYQNDDDGFSGSVTDDKLIKGQILRWNETNGWIDRDGLRPPEPLLVLATTEALQRFQNKKPLPPIMTKPLPDVDELNAKIPVVEWETGLDGRPTPPWKRQVVIYLIDPVSAGLYTYLNSTIGARIAWDQLRERVTTMRLLRGVKVVPLVRLNHRPMKTSFGMKHRPDFTIVDWRKLGGSEPAIEAPKQPQLTGPVSEQTKPSSPAEETLSTMKTVDVPTTAEEIADSIPW